MAPTPHRALLACLAALLVAPSALRAQDLVGCQLTDDGQLQCVPGVSADPQSQIRALRQQIANDLQLEGAVQQQIAGLEQLALAGQAAEGQLLTATLAATAGAGPLPPTVFHWYRRLPGSSSWVLINGASGPSYRLQSVDVAARVMLIIAVPGSTGSSQRQASPPVGPVQPRQP